VLLVLADPREVTVMDDNEAKAVMARFGSAYFSKRAERLADAVTPDAEWHFAFGPDGPDGRVRKGVAGFMQGMAENDDLFQTLRFDDVVIRGMGEDQIVMTYTANGRRRTGEDFSLRGVELVTAKDGRVHKKDVFWKQLAL
jgi:ketosteroid isomerase-like protein